MNTNHRPPTDKELTEARLTAYALDQLDRTERRAVEAELAESPEARRTVEEIRALAGHVREAARHDASFEPSAALRTAVEERLSQLEDSPMATRQDPSPTRRRRASQRRWIALAVAACLLIAAIPMYFAATNVTPNAREVAMTQAGPGEREEYATHGAQQAGQRADELRQAVDSLSTLLDAEKSAKREGDAVWWRDRAVLSTPSGEQLPDPQQRAHQYLSGAVQAGTEAMPGSGSPYGSAGRGSPQGEGYLTVTEEEESGQYGYSSFPGYARTEDHAGSGAPAQGQSRKSPDLQWWAGGLHELHGSADSVMASGPPILYPSAETWQELNARRGQGPGGEKAAQREGPPSQDGTSNTVVLVPDLVMRVQRHPGRVNINGADGSARYTREDVAENSYGRLIRSGGGGISARASGRAGVPGTEQYDAVIENPFLPVGKCPLSTFAIDVDTASYANVRRFLNEGRWPPPAAVRIEEMVNYFKYDYPPPEDEQPFSVHMEVAQCPWNGQHRLLRIGLKGREIDRDQRGPTNLVFLLDVSGSMRDANKLALVKQAMRMLVDQLTEDDRVAIVTYASSAAVQLQCTCGDNQRTILAAIDSLTAGGSTHGSAGIQLAYEQASYHFVQGGTNRVILATDGDLNVGVTEDDQLVRLIQEKAKTGVFLTVLGFGTGNLKDSKLEKLADKGNGTYAYIDSLREAWKVLVEQVTGSLVTIAKDVKVQIEFNPAEVQSYRLIGYENRILAARDFQDDRKDAGEIGAGHTVTALYELVPAGEDLGLLDAGGPELKYQRVRKKPSAELTRAAQTGELFTLRLRYKEPDGDQSKLSEFTLEDSGKRFGEASPDFQFAAAVAALGMVLRDSAYQGDLMLTAVEEFALSGVGDDSEGYRAEFVDLVRRARQIADP